MAAKKKNSVTPKAAYCRPRRPLPRELVRPRRPGEDDEWGLYLLQEHYGLDDAQVGRSVVLAHLVLELARDFVPYFRKEAKDRGAKPFWTLRRRLDLYDFITNELAKDDEATVESVTQKATKAKEFRGVAAKTLERYYYRDKARFDAWPKSRPGVGGRFAVRYGVRGRNSGA